MRKVFVAKKIENKNNDETTGGLGQTTICLNFCVNLLDGGGFYIYFQCKRSIGGTLVDLPIFLDNQLTKVIGIFAEFVEFADYVE